MGINNKVKRFKNQNYSRLRASCRNGILFEDSEFPANDASLKFPPGKLGGHVEWKRPTEICSDPKLVVGRLNGSNTTQGSLGNCWFVAACCALARERELWCMVVPNSEQQDYTVGDPRRHGGIFHFRFWSFGRWVDVTIDDRLPTIHGKLIFAHSQLDNEFWCSLLEKAYAKLHGSYAAMESGNLVDALVDFTAGFAERIDVIEHGARSTELKRIELFRHMREEAEHHSLMCCAIKATSPEDMNGRTEMGLVKGHAYCVTDVRKVNIARTGLFAIFKGRDKLRMIRLRNPWGEKEWIGAFSDGSEEWSRVSAKDREKVGLTFQDDGEFWMTFEDFCAHFTFVSICHLVNTSWFSLAKTWHVTSTIGRWIDGPKGSRTDRAGGCSNHKETFLLNPQYCFDIKSERSKMLIMLQQKDVRGEVKPDSRIFSIGFQILKTEANRKYRLHAVRDMVESSEYIETRNVFHRCELNQGRYVLIPTTFVPRQAREFVLRCFSESNVCLRELKLDRPKPPLFSCLTSQWGATVVRVKEGRDIAEPKSSETCSPYFILFCENKKVRGPTLKNTNQPKWEFGAVFYRKNSKSNLKIQVWSSRLLKDLLLAEVTLDLKETEERVGRIVTLTRPKSTAQDVEPTGKLVVELFSTTNLSAV